MQKTYFLSLFIFLLLLPVLQGQNIFLELKTELNVGDLKYSWNHPVTNQSSLDRSDKLYDFSIGVSGQIYKFVYLKTVIGTNDFENFVDIKWTTNEATFSPQQEHSLFGYLSANQTFIEVLPEIRILKNQSVFINAGIGINQIRNSEFINGYYSRNSFNSFDPMDFPDFEGHYLFYAFNLGVNFQIEKIGIIVELGRRISTTTKKKSHTPGIGINQKNFKLGISYQLSSIQK